MATTVIATRVASNHVIRRNSRGFLINQIPHKTTGSHASTPREVGWQIVENKTVKIKKHQVPERWWRDSLDSSCRKRMIDIEEHKMTKAKGRNSVPKKSELFSTARMSPDTKPASKLLVHFEIP
jgi:hypothetical protein